MIRIDEKVWVLLAVMLLLLPMKWLLAVIAAACIHEAAHIGAVLLLGGKIFGIYLGPFGAVIEAERISGLREVVCSLAGPLGSLLLVFMIHEFPIFGLCGLVQGIFNLLPIYPLDGGRALLRLLEVMIPEKARKISASVEFIVLCFVFGTAFWETVRYSLGYVPVFFAALGILNVLVRKRP